MEQDQGQAELERRGNENIDPQKVYYKYVNDTVQNNMPVAQVSDMITRLRDMYNVELNRVIGSNDAPRKTAIQLKNVVRASDAAIEKFAVEHPRMFDQVMSSYTSPRDLEMIRTMLPLRQAVNDGVLTESVARSLLNELLLKHHALPANVDREEMCDRRIERKAQEGSFLGFDPAGIPYLKEMVANLPDGAVGHHG
jgi:hypothetical protein